MNQEQWEDISIIFAGLFAIGVLGFFLPITDHYGQGTNWTQTVNISPSNSTVRDVGFLEDYVTVTLFKNNTTFAASYGELTSYMMKGWKLQNQSDGGVYLSYTSKNLVTNAGITFLASKAHVTGYASNAVYAEYIALTTDSTGPAYTDTTLTSEISTNGLQRAQASCSNGSAASGDITTTCSKTFTATGSFTAVQQAGMFTASANGIMYAHNTFSSVNMVSGDTLTISWAFAYTN